MAVRVTRAGPLTTVQDLGRPGRQALGVSVGGAMDEVALRVANLLVGNPQGAAGLELTLQGPSLTFEREVVLALTGAELPATLDGVELARWRPVVAQAGSVLEVGTARTGCRGYLAFGGGVEVPVVLGGRGTDLKGRFGGLEGRALRAGDLLQLGVGGRAAATDGVDALIPPYVETPTLRILRGPEWEWLGEDGQAALLRSGFEVSARSDRMGYRLVGAPVRPRGARELISSAVAPGTIQAPPDGAPIVLMADRQTTGGYPRIAQVISVDLPLLAQLRPGSQLSLIEVSLAEAQAWLREREQRLRSFAEALASVGG